MYGFIGNMIENTTKQYRESFLFGRVLCMSNVDTKSSINLRLYGKLLVVQNKFCEAESTCNICYAIKWPLTFGF